MVRVAYILSKDLVQVSSLLPSNKMRSNMVHSLVSATGLLRRAEDIAGQSSDSSSVQLQIIKPKEATRKELIVYHTADYIDYVLDPSNCSDEPEDMEEDAFGERDNENFGLEDDCPLFVGLDRYVPLVAGASLTAAEVLKRGVADIAICWDGGRHHAQKSHAAGFCYVADCVLAILSLKKPPVPSLSLPSSSGNENTRPRIMYLDLDLHYSDAVSQAFSSQLTSSSAMTPQVLTLSIHHNSPGFFPPPSALSSLPTSLEDVDPFTLSIPLLAGASNATFRRIWHLVEGARDAFHPEYVVLQCGVDGLAEDPCAIWNWSLGGKEEEGSLGWCVNKVLGWKAKTLMLGGGGYNSPNAARAWTYLTSIALGKPLSLDMSIPEHPAFPLYAPSFTLDVAAGNMQDQNTEEHLRKVEGAIGSVIGRLKEVMSK